MDFPSLVLYLLITLPFIFSIWSLIKRTKTKQNLPPGPWPLPLIGNLLKLGDQPHKSLTKLAKIHGPIIALKLGQVTTIVISSSIIAKEALQKQDLAFSSRSVPNALHAHDHYRYSIVWLPVSDRWRSLRKIFNSVISANNRLDSNQYLRRKKVDELLVYASKCCEKGEAVDVGRAAFTTSLNILSNTVFSLDLADPSEESSRQFKDLIWNIMEEAGKPNAVDYFPILSKVDLQGIRRRMTVHFGKVLELFGTLIDERLESRRSHKINGENDVLDALLNISEGNNEEIDRTHIERLFVDLFAAGTDTTSSTIEWAMAEVLHDPNILEKAKMELEKTIGKGKKVEESDVARLPYLQAIMKETMRKHPPVPFLIPRKVDTDVEISGYKIPKGSQVLVNVWAIGRDPSLWDSPTLFKPERFLGSEIDVKGRDFELIPFGAGRRICPGLALAVRIVPVVVGSLLNSFDWKFEGGILPKELDMDEKFGITLQRANPLRVVPFRF
uniref:Geraniol 10-hydroxylase 1 n=1 Tax=Primula forbesii TaxID=175067 RepID=A0A140HEY3_9ERIC|nr:geraniol 10-hydroxylase 1 [Primula forbesii]